MAAMKILPSIFLCGSIYRQNPSYLSERFPTVIIEEAVGYRRECEAETPRTLQHAAHETSGARRPGLHCKRRTGGPLRAHSGQRLSSKEIRHLA